MNKNFEIRVHNPLGTRSPFFGWVGEVWKRIKSDVDAYELVFSSKNNKSSEEAFGNALEWVKKNRGTNEG